MASRVADPLRANAFIAPVRVTRPLSLGTAVTELFIRANPPYLSRTVGSGRYSR